MESGSDPLNEGRSPDVCRSRVAGTAVLPRHARCLDHRVVASVFQVLWGAANLDMGTLAVSFQIRSLMFSVDWFDFPYWRTHAQASSGDVQSRASASFDCQRPHGISPELPILLRDHRKITFDYAAGPAFARYAALHTVWAGGPVHRRRRLSDFPGHRNRMS